MPHSSASIELAELGVLRIRGADAVRFLQGQLSNDLTRLGPGRALMAGYHNPQGRAIAVLRLLERAADDLLAVLPRELIGSVASRLARVVLRAKVRLSDESESLRVLGAVQDAAPAGLAVRICEAPVRWLTLSERAADEAHADGSAAARERWKLLDIAAGLPQVYARTSEAFVAQMLNLDLIDAIAFSKGCYTGQEVIARAHYRGRVKRRMQRWRTLAPAELEPGESGVLADGRGFRVVECARLADGRCEFLAVAPLEARATDTAPDAEETPPGAGGHPALEAEPLALPYALPS